MKTISVHSTRLLLASLFLALCGAAQAQGNALANPNFDTDFSGWDEFEDRVGVWSELDADGSANSGSALLSFIGQSFNNIPLVLYQCIPAFTNVEYPFGGDVLVPAGQPTNTAAFVVAQTYDSADCTGDFEEFADAFSATVDEWTSVENTITTGAATQSIRIGIGVFKPAGVNADAQAHFDNVYLELPDLSLVRPAMAASWFNPDESGHGVMIHLMSSTEAWMCWFTFDLDGNPAWICALGTIDGDTITFNQAFQVEGGAFPPNFDPDQIVEVPWGSIVVVFTGCDSGNLTWVTEAPGFQSGEMPISRLTNSWGASCP